MSRDPHGAPAASGATRVADIIRWTEGLSGHALNRDEGVRHGSADAVVTSTLVCWMATSEALEEAGRRGADLVLCHESLYYPYDAAVKDNNPADWRAWRANARRLELLETHRLTLLRVHGSMDEITIYDDFAALLGLGDPVHRNGFVRVYEIAECSYGDLIERVKRATGMEGVRCSFPDELDRRVGRVGLPWGGLGLYTNVGYQRKVLDLGVDALIAGETDNYGFRFAAEWGVPMIETSHETSENPGIERFTRMLDEAFPSARARYYENRRVWGMK